MLMTYYAEVEAKCHDDSLAIAENTYKAWEICAEQLGISVEEYIAFMQDMEIETFDYTLAEIEQMYVEYCQEFDIPCMQIDIGVPMKLYGAI